MYAQLIDDVSGKTLLAASSLKGVDSKQPGIEVAKSVGALIAKLASEKDIQSVVFDRSGFIYHGRIKALAEAAREAGLKF
jgi:large subunit ribosomal protein L18